MFRHILVPTDGSPAAARAAAAAVLLAKATGAKVTGFFAAPPATPIVFDEFLPAGYMPPDEHADMIDRMARKYLGVIEKLAAEAGVPCEVAHVTSDFPADAILEAAAQRKCDLICLAPHAHRGLTTFLLGSQTQKVLAHAKIPVLVYR
ncbi:MAG TPA: universal stress protein [Casimicrobiaceae bacterium]|nr:universal stress protein [Casimicrobiaceae bacterium]